MCPLFLSRHYRTTNLMRNLLPCKHCGHAHPGTVYRDGIDEFDSVQEALDLGALEEEINYQVRCPQCSTTGPATATEPGALAAWNNLMM